MRPGCFSPELWFNKRSNFGCCAFSGPRWPVKKNAAWCLSRREVTGDATSRRVSIQPVWPRAFSRAFFIPGVLILTSSERRLNKSPTDGGATLRLLLLFYSDGPTMKRPALSPPCNCFFQVYFYIRKSNTPFSLYLRVSEPFSSSRTSKNRRNSPQMFRSRLARPNGGGGVAPK